MLGSILTYTPGTEGAIGTIAWDFSSILTIAMATLGACIAAGAVIFLAVWGFRMLKRFIAAR